MEQDIRRPVLLCYDGSLDARHAIAEAGRLLGAGPAIVLIVQEPLPDWEPYDPASVISAPLERLATRSLDLEEIDSEVTREILREGIALAEEAGFRVQGRLGYGRPSRAICEVAKELDARVVVVGARGLSRMAGLLQGSVSAGVCAGAHRPVLVVPPAADADA